MTHLKERKQRGIEHLKVPAIVQVHEDGRFAAVVHHRNFGCHLQVGSPNLLGVPEEHEVAQAVAVFSHWVKGVGCLDDIYNFVNLYRLYIFYFSRSLHVGLLKFQSELDNVIRGCGSPALKGDVAQVSSDTRKKRSSSRE